MSGAETSKTLYTFRYEIYLKICSSGEKVFYTRSFPYYWVDASARFHCAEQTHLIWRLLTTIYDPPPSLNTLICISDFKFNNKYEKSKKEKL